MTFNNGFITIDELKDDNNRLITRCGVTGNEITFLSEYEDVICNDCATVVVDDLKGGFMLYETDDSDGMACESCDQQIYGIYDDN